MRPGPYDDNILLNGLRTSCAETALRLLARTIAFPSSRALSRRNWPR